MNMFKKRIGFILVLVVATLPMSCMFMGYDKKSGDTNLPPYLEDMDIYSPDEPAIEKAGKGSLPPSGPLRITLNDAILSTMENNPSLVVERFNPSIQKTFTDEEQAVFDPVLGGKIAVERNDVANPGITGRGTIDTTTDDYAGTISLKEYFPTGTFIELGFSGSVTDVDQSDDPYAKARVGLSVTQSLLRGYDIYQIVIGF